MCGHLIKKFGHAENMPRQLFTLLLLDLTPLGGHEFSSATALKEPVSKRGPEPKIVASNAASDTEDNSAEFTHYEQSMLFLSDAIARARLEAAKQADSTTTKAIAFGWITVALSGLATLFVAIKASMPVPKEADGKKKGYLWTFYTVGYFEMLLSATVTVLSSAKQFYDPQRTYKSSEAALLELRKLQNQVSFEFIQTWDDAKCTTEGNAPQLQSWAQRLANIEAVIVEASANLQDADLEPISSSRKIQTGLMLQANTISRQPGNEPGCPYKRLLHAWRRPLSLDQSQLHETWGRPSFRLFHEIMRTPVFPEAAPCRARDPPN
jgi:hypothetical protein